MYNSCENESFDPHKIVEMLAFNERSYLSSIYIYNDYVQF